jgi:hypothetical protein
VVAVENVMLVKVGLFAVISLATLLRVSVVVINAAISAADDQSHVD